MLLESLKSINERVSVISTDQDHQITKEACVSVAW